MLAKPFTYNYQQPEEYRFSLDSIEMPYEVSHLYKDKDLSKLKILDLCAGCGVIGFEFQFHCPTVQKIDFVEVQNEYKNYFQKNLEIVKPQNKEFRFLEMNYADLLTDQHRGQYDIVLCNPPYFLPGQGKLSPSEFKNRCRFFMDSDFETLVQVLMHVTSPSGEVFLLLRELEEHGWDLLTRLRTLSRGQLSFENHCMIRTAFLLHGKREL